jgi:ligand-binding sensor domain-containing protein
VWTDQDGLPQNTIGGIAQTQDGYLWFGTIRGLVRFDGIRFTVFNSTNTDAFVYDNIYTLFVDREGTLWVGPDGGGLVRYRNGEFKRYAEPEGFTSDGIRAIRQDRAGNIWIAARDLYRFRDGKFTHWGVNEGLLHSSASSILEDKAGRLWVGNAKGLDLFQDGKFIHYSTEQGLASGRVWAIHEDRQANLWIGSAEGMAWNPVNRGGLSLFKDGKFKVYSTQNGLPHNAVISLAEDQEGNLWIATSGGLCRYSEGRFTSSPPKDFLLDNNITSLFVDREGSLARLSQARECADGNAAITTGRGVDLVE